MARGRHRRAGARGRPRRSGALRAALGDAGRVVSCAHARHTAAILAAAPAGARLVLLGSTRRFTRWPDAHGNGVMAGEAALLASGRSGVMLHPTMIYGAQGEDNVQRLAALLRRLPVVPLPGGGRALVQPIHQDDLTRCDLAALRIAWDGPHALVIAGPAPLPYAGFVARRGRRRRAAAAAHGGGAGLAAAGRRAADRPARPAAHPRRRNPPAAGGQGVSTSAPMFATLGIQPIPLTEGLARTFAR